MEGRWEEMRERAGRASGWEEGGGRGQNVEEGGQRESLHNYVHVKPTTDHALYVAVLIIIMQVSVNVCDSL